MAIFFRLRRATKRENPKNKLLKPAAGEKKLGI
jgi:hypothetical protein